MTTDKDQLDAQPLSEKILNDIRQPTIEAWLNTNEAFPYIKRMNCEYDLMPVFSAYDPEFIKRIWMSSYRPECTAGDRGRMREAMTYSFLATNHDLDRADNLGIFELHVRHGELNIVWLTPKDCMKYYKVLHDAWGAQNEAIVEHFIFGNPSDGNGYRVILGMNNEVTQ